MGLLSDLAETLVIKYFPTSCLALANAAHLSLSDPQGFLPCHPAATYNVYMATVLSLLLGLRTQKDKSSAKSFSPLLSWQTHRLILQDKLNKAVSEK